MKRIGWIVAGLLPLFTASFGLAQATDGFISKTKHNFGANGYSWAGGEICKPCHTPHNTIHPELSTRLWSHTLSGDKTPVEYTIRGATPQGEKATPEHALDGYSRLCMGCHDGTVALGDFVGSPDVGVPFGAQSKMNLGTDLMNDHPVGLEAVYETTHLRPFNTAKSRVDSVIIAGASLPLIKVTENGTEEYVVSCKTCHNPHGTNLAGTGEPYPKLLRMTNSGSAMCLSCHKK